MTGCLAVVQELEDMVAAGAVEGAGFGSAEGHVRREHRLQGVKVAGDPGSEAGLQAGRVRFRRS